MNTIKLFRENAYQKNFNGRVTEIHQNPGNILIVLDQTCFFPTGGGQSCDLGFINSMPVMSVHEDDGKIYHKVSDLDTLKVGDVVSGQIDWERRFRNMQKHCGEHILSGVFFKEYSGINKGFHMGDDYITIDISLEESIDQEILTWDMAMNVEMLSNKIIWENLPITTRYFHSAEEASKLPLRKPVSFNEDISIICVGPEDSPADCVACCGIHPSFSGEVGLIKILKIESNKGMFRVYFKVGEEAFNDYREKHEIIASLNNKYSSNTYDLLDKITIQDQKTKELKTQFNQIKQMVIKERIFETELTLKENSGIVIKEFPVLQIDDLISIGRSVTEKINKLLIIVSKEESTVLLFSTGKTIDCGKLINETVSIYNGKGGGSKSHARGIFPRSEDIVTYLDLLEKHLR